MKTTSINERIELIISTLELNKNSFSRKIGLSNSTVVGNIVSGRMNKPSFEVLHKILTTFDQVSADWLITGKGEMMKAGGPDQSRRKEPKPKTEDCAQCEHKQEIIEMQQARIESLNKVIESKDQLINYITNSEIPQGRLNDCG